MPTDSIHKLDSFSVAAAAESQNRERDRDRDGRKEEKNKAAPKAEETKSAETPVGPDLAASQIVDSSTLVELLAHRPAPTGQARFLLRNRPAGVTSRQKPDGKKLDKSA